MGSDFVTRKSAKALFLILFLGLGLFFTLPHFPQTQAWGLATHMWLTDEAIDALPSDSWKDAFEYFASDIKSGSITPDTVWQDWDNHLYYPITQQYTAHIATERWFNYMVNNLSMGNWKEGMFAAGVMSHYYADPNIPIHTDANWPGHSVLEGDINDHLATFNISIPAPQIVSDPRQAVVDAATTSHDYYNDCRALYPDYTQPIPSPLTSNGSFHDMIETQLERAATGIRNLWYSAVQGLEAPNIPTGAISYTIFIDAGHDNAYTDTNQLTNFKNSLTAWGLNVIEDSDGITATDLLGVDLLVITAPYTNFTLAETNAIADWFVNGTRTNILASGYSDFENQYGFKRPSVNYLMANCTSHLRLNDDQIFNPDGVQLWYCDITQIVSPTLTFNMTRNVSAIRMFSTSSLYYTDPSAVTNITFGNENFYQTDVYSPAATIIYDNTDDGMGGDRIPLMAVEQVGDSRIMLSGTTFFSDYDYPIPDNEVFIENVCEWLLNTSLIELDVFGPTISNVTPSPNPPRSGEALTISATITDPAGVNNATLFYEIDAGGEQTISMTPTASLYSAQIPANQIMTGGIITYHIKTYDLVDNWKKTLATNLTVQANPPSSPTLNDPGAVSSSGNFTISWTASSDIDGTVSHYQLQQSTSADFSANLQEWNTTTTSQVMINLSDGAYFYRVRAFDNEDNPSNWSNSQSISVERPPTTLPPPPINPVFLGIIGGVIVITVVVVGLIYYVVRKD